MKVLTLVFMEKIREKYPRIISLTPSILSLIQPLSISVLTNYNIFQTGTTELLLEDKNAVREYLCIKAYLVSLGSFLVLFTCLGCSGVQGRHLCLESVYMPPQWELIFLKGKRLLFCGARLP